MSSFEFAPTVVHTLEVGAMTCGHCKMKVEKALNSIPEIDSADVDLIDGTVEVTMSKEIDKELMRNVLEDAGHPLLSFN